MHGYFATSDAASIALHAVILIAGTPDGQVKIRDIAGRFDLSEAHLAKVLNRLARAGILTATRGPAGGFRLAKDAEDITLWDLYVAIEGERTESRCMFRIPSCDGRGCPLGEYFTRISADIDEKLRGTTVAQLAPGLPAPA